MQLSDEQASMQSLTSSVIELALHILSHQSHDQKMLWVAYLA